jgi:hypothetical protein
VGSVVTLATLDIDMTDVRTGDSFDKNDFIAVVGGLTGRKVKRVWMRFPLTKEEASMALGAFRKFSTVQLAQEIRKDAVKAETDPKVDPKVDPKAPMKGHVLNATDKARWFELAGNADATQFSTRVTLQDVKALRGRFPQAYRLLVYEFDDGKGPPEAILVTERPKGSRVAVILQKIEAWGPGLDEIIKTDDKPGDTPGGKEKTGTPRP